MKSKLLVVAVLLLIVASLSVAGCTASNNNQSPVATASVSPSAATSTATHDAFLEKYLATLKNVSYSDKNYSFKAWEVTWINSTSARVEYTMLNKTANVTVNGVTIHTVFPTTQDATNYLNAMNKTAYSLASTIYPAGREGTYWTVAGHAPQIYKAYVWNEGNPFNISEYKRHEIYQLDNIVSIYTGKVLS